VLWDSRTCARHIVCNDKRLRVFLRRPYVPMLSGSFSLSCFSSPHFSSIPVVPFGLCVVQVKLYARHTGHSEEKVEEDIRRPLDLSPG